MNAHLHSIIVVTFFYKLPSPLQNVRMSKLSRPLIDVSSEVSKKNYPGNGLFFAKQVTFTEHNDRVKVNS